MEVICSKGKCVVKEPSVIDKFRMDRNDSFLDRIEQDLFEEALG